MSNFASRRQVDATMLTIFRRPTICPSFLSCRDTNASWIRYDQGFTRTDYGIVARHAF